jgi:AAA+ superfamily predicted ATPase
MITYALLFFGNSGTGKTMLANTVATKLEKKSLLVNFPTFGVNSSGASLKFLLREARINRAVLFFDERESLFLDQEKGGSSVNMLLT